MTSSPATRIADAPLEKRELEARIDGTLHELRQAVDTLEDRARRRIDPTERIRRRPEIWLVGAFALGFLWGWRR